MRLAISALVSLLVIAQLDASGAGNDAPLARIRPMQRDGARALADGIAHSPTFRRLVDHLEGSHVIGGIDLRPDMPAHRGGSLRFLARSATDRFLKIQLNRVFTGRTLVALLGHELQHAVEVADAGAIDSSADLRDLYRRLGEKTGIDQFDTAAARRVGYIVRQELKAGAQVDLWLARTDDAQAIQALEDLGDETADSDEHTGSVPAMGTVGLENGTELARQ